MLFILNSNNSEKWYEGAWQVLYKNNYERVYRTALDILWDVELAKDAAQETFVRAFLNINTLKDKEKFGVWVCTIAINTSKNMLKSKIKQNEKCVSLYDKNGNIKNIVTEMCDFNTPEKTYEDDELIHEILTSIEELSLDEQMIIYLKYYKEFTYTQIAQYLELNISTVKMRFHRAKEKILNKLGKYSDYERVEKL